MGFLELYPITFTRICFKHNFFYIISCVNHSSIKLNNKHEARMLFKKMDFRQKKILSDVGIFMCS